MARKECSFCNTTEREENPFIAGNNAYICSNCVTSAYKILFGEEEGFEQNDAPQNLLIPKEIHRMLNDYVIGQDKAYLELDNCLILFGQVHSMLW
jgi:ATP-dependent Clp protease ATP-binding subunit ClpX